MVYPEFYIKSDTKIFHGLYCTDLVLWKKVAKNKPGYTYNQGQ